MKTLGNNVLLSFPLKTQTQLIKRRRADKVEDWKHFFSLETDLTKVLTLTYLVELKYLIHKGNDAKMLTKVILTFSTLISVSTFDEKEFYCKAIPGLYKICKKCPVSTFDESCEVSKSSGCYCENIEIATEKGKSTLNIETHYRIDLHTIIFHQEQKK